MKSAPHLLLVLGAACAATPPPHDGRLDYAASLAAARERALAAERPILLVFHAVWCPACRRFQRDTLAAPEVRAAAGAFEWVHVDVDREATATREFEVAGTPTFVVLAADGQERLGRLQGDPGPAGFVSFLAGFAGERPQAPAASPEGTDDRADRTPLTLVPGGYRGRSICFSHVGYGPLDVPSQSPASVLRLALDPRTPSTLAQGQWELSWSETLTNFWAYEPGEYRLDYGALYSTLSIGYGVSDTWQVEAELVDFRRFDSVLDDLTNAWHSAFGLGASGRDEFPDNENVILLETDAGTLLSEDEQSYSQDIALTVQNNVTCGTATLPAFAWALTARTNTGGDVQLEGDTNLSVGLSLATARRFGERWYAYATLGHVWHGLDSWRGLPLEDTQLSLLVAGEWRYAPRCSWVAQYLITDAVTDALSPFDEPSHEFNLGWKGEVGEGTVLELGLLENAFVVDNSPDVGLHFGLRHRF